MVFTMEYGYVAKKNSEIIDAVIKLNANHKRIIKYENQKKLHFSGKGVFLCLTKGF